MKNRASTNTLLLLQTADKVRTKLSGEIANVHGFSVSEFLLLMHLQQATLGKLSRVELAKRMNLSASTITRMAAPLEKIGILARESNPRDARLAFVVLTKTGETRLDEAKNTFAKLAQTMFSDQWSDEELEQLSKLLLKLVSTGASNLLEFS